MDASVGRPDEQGLGLHALGTIVVERSGRIVAWSKEAARLLARPAEDVLGLPLRELLAVGAQWAPEQSTRLPQPGAGRTQLRGAGGEAVEVIFWAEATGGEAGLWLINFVPAPLGTEWRQGVALLRALLDQHEIGISLRDADLRLERTNITSGMFGAPAMESAGQFDDVVWARDAAEAEAILTEVLRTGVPVISQQHRWQSGQIPPQDRTVSVSAFRLEETPGDPSGVAVIVEDVTEQERIRRQRELLHSAATRIGFSLDVRDAAQALADVVHEVCDLVTVDLTEHVLTGDQLSTVLRGDPPMVRAAVAVRGRWPESLPHVGETFPPLPDSPQVRELLQGRPIVETGQDIVRPLGEDETLIRRLVPEGAHSLVASPLFARGLMLGVVSGWRTAHSPAFDDGEVQLLGEISSRAALGIDNARRYAYEHRTALALQQQLLPRAVTDLTAAHTVGAYSPAGGSGRSAGRLGRGAGVGGDWFDVIALPSLRVAFVVGDVVGHGLPAAAGMGRLRTAVQNFASLELEPAEVLAHMEDLVQRMAAETSTNDSDTSGATCMFAVYDPITRQCTFASAGQPAPVFVQPDGSTEQLDIPPGPPLGVGWMAYESTTVTLEPGGILALFTDGLLELEPYAGGAAVHRVKERLVELWRDDYSLEQIGAELLEAADRTETRDDIAVLLARINAVDSGSVVSWDFPGEAGSVAKARALAARQLEVWGLTELTFTTELVVSELVTNAVRYAWGPIRVRLIRDEVLTCEVSDPSNTQPRLIRAAGTDEGGRGMFIVAQCTTRWGARYVSQGKTIWTEQPLPPGRKPANSTP